MNDLLMSDVTLYKRAHGSRNEYGNPDGAITPHTLRGAKVELSEFRWQEAGLPDDATKFVLLQFAAPAVPASGDVVSVDGAAFYALLSVNADPAGATWEAVARVTQNPDG